MAADGITSLTESACFHQHVKATDEPLDGVLAGVAGRLAETFSSQHPHFLLTRLFWSGASIITTSFRGSLDNGDSSCGALLHAPASPFAQHSDRRTNTNVSTLKLVLWGCARELLAPIVGLRGRLST